MNGLSIIYSNMKGKIIINDEMKGFFVIIGVPEIQD